MQLQETSLQQQVVKLDTQARQAVSSGKEDLARVALERKNIAQTELQGLDTQVTELEDQQQKLTDSEQKLRAKIEAFRTKKEVIKAQYSAAEAQVKISEAATGVGEQMADVGLAMQRAVDKTENMKARADAVQELEAAGTFDDITALGPGEDDIDRQLKSLSSKSAVDDDLAKMKGELGRERGAARVSFRRAGSRRAVEGDGHGRSEQGAVGMIVRISGEDQYRLDEDCTPSLTSSPVPRTRAVDADDEGRFSALARRAACLRARQRHAS